MHIPRYLRRVFQVVDLSDKLYLAAMQALPRALDVFAWGYSDVSPADAVLRARHKP